MSVGQSSHAVNGVLRPRQYFAAIILRGAKKRLHSRRAEPDDRTEVQILSDGRWTREEDTPSAGWAFAEGGEFSDCPVVAQPGPREEETGQIDSDHVNMLCGT